MKTIGDYKLFQFLGKGTYGEIYLAKKGNDPQLYAAKILDKKRMDGPKMNKYFEREIRINQELNHPNIVKFYEKLNDDNNYYLIVEYCNGGNLSQCMQKYLSVYKEPFSIEIVQHFMRQIISAFCHIHSLGIIHRDIKLDNILLSFDNEEDIKKLNLLNSKIKVIDFGVATKLDEEEYAFTAVGTPLTMDPLILKKYMNAGGVDKLQGYNEKADIWSLGTIFYQLLTGQRMYTFSTMQEFMKKVEEGTYVVPINKNFSKEVISFLNCMLQHNPDDRVSVQNLAQHKFITDNVNSFTKTDLKQIFHKIDKDGNMIIKMGDAEIIEKFNVAKKISSKESKDKKENEDLGKKGSLNKANTYEEEDYTFAAGIYNANTQDDNNRANSEKINVQRKNVKRYTDNKYANNQLQELTKIEEEMKQTEIKDREDEERKRLEREKREKEERETEIREKEKREKNIINEKEEAKLYIKGLLDEYNAAKGYFNKNGLTHQEQDATRKYNCLENILKEFEQATKINYESLPKPITPEYIYNCPVQKRNAIFKEIIDDYKKRKVDLELSIKNEILKYQKLDSETFALIKNEVISKLENDRKKVEKYKKVIEAIEDRYNNKWTPAPEITKDKKFGEYEKISFEGCVYKLIIHPTKTNYYNSSNNLVLRLTMKINEDKKYYGDIKIINFGDFEDDISWHLNENEWNNLSNYFINVDFFLDAVFKGNQKINVNNLKENQRLKISYPIPFLNQPEKAFINLDIRIIMPEGKKIITKEVREIINIKKNFLPFDGKSPYTNEIPRLFSK